MDDLEQRLASLRRALNDRISAPTAAEIVARARRRRAQRAAQYAVAGLVAVLAVVVPVLTVAGGGHAARPAVPGPGVVDPGVVDTVTVTTTSAATVTETSVPPGSTAASASAATSHAVGAAGRLVYAADLRSQSHIYALVGVPGPQGAVTRLYATADGGSTWTQRPTPLPAVTGDDGYTADLVALGGGGLLLWQPLIPDAPWGFASWYSADAGASWTRVTDRSGGQAATMDTIPAGAVLTTECAVADSHPDRCVAWTLEAVDPGTGERAVLTHQPEMDLLRANWIEPAADGRWWVSGTVDGTPAVAVSTDGSSWAVHRLPATGTPTRIEVAVAGSDVWAVAGGSTDTEKNALLGIAVSRDFGATWSLLYRPSAGTAPRTFVGAPIPYPSGSGSGVVISTGAPNDDMAYLVRGDGSTVASARPAPGWVRWTGRGYVSMVDNTVYASLGGSVFRPLTPLG